MQDEPVAMLAPDKLTVPEPATAVGVPPQVLFRLLGVATTIPAGRVSENATPVSATAFAAGLVMVKLRVETPLTAMVVGLKALAMEGGATTSMEADAVPPVPPSVEVISPVVLLCVPGAMPTTFTENVHEAEAASVAPDRFTTENPETVPVVTVPVQVLVRPFGVAILRPTGSVSPKPMPLSDVLVLGFWTVKVSVVPPLSGMLAAPNALIRTGGAVTVIDALDVLPTPLSVALTVTLLFLTPDVVP